MGKKIKALCFTDGIDNTKETILATTEEALQSGERVEEIAEKFKKSPAYVSKCLSLLDMPPALQQKIVKGEISVMAAKEIVKSYSTEDEQIKAAKAAIKDAKSQGKATASNKEVSQHLKDTKEVGNMIGTIYKLQAYLNGEDQIQLSVLLKQLQHSATLSQAIRQYFHVINQNKKTE